MFSFFHRKKKLHVGKTETKTVSDNTTVNEKYETIKEIQLSDDTAYQTFGKSQIPVDVLNGVYMNVDRTKYENTLETISKKEIPDGYAKISDDGEVKDSSCYGSIRNSR